MMQEYPRAHPCWGWGGAQVGVWTWTTSSAVPLRSTCWNLQFPPVERLFLILLCVTTHLLKPGRFYLKRLGQKAAAPSVCTRMCQGMLWGGTTWLWAIRRLGATRRCVEREGCRKLTSSNLFFLERKFRGKLWLMLTGKPSHGKTRVNLCATSDQIYNPGNYSL